MDELTIAFKIESPPSWLPIGRTAENNWRTVEIDCSYWFNMNANGEVVLMYKPSCGMSPYPLLTERDGDNIVWRPKSGELVEGVGRLQAFFEVGTDVIGSSDMISCEVDSSLLGVDPGTDPGQTDLPWALDIIEQIAELSGHYPKIVDGDLYIWDSTLNDWVEFEASGGGAVDSVNGKTGVVMLDASDVGALSDDTQIPSKTSDLTNDAGFVTAQQAAASAPVQSVNNKTGAVTLGASDVHALPDSTVIPVVPQMATQVNMSDWTSGKTVDASTLKTDFQYALNALVEAGKDVESLRLNKADKTELPDASTSAPVMDGTAAVGTSTDYARADHVHPSDTTRLSTTGNAYRSASIPMGHLDSTSTATVMTATVDGITELRDGVCMWLRNGVVTSASGFTLNVNGLGAKPCYSSLAAASRSTTIFNVNYTMLLIYNSTRVDGGCWDIVYGVDTNTTYTPVKLGFGYGTCTTAAATAAKTASISSYALTAGGIVSIKFDNAVPAGATLNISSKGAKAIYHRGAAITANVIKAGDTATFVYSTYYHLIAIDRDESGDVLPSVTASDNGKVLGVVNGAWAVKSDDSGTTVTVDSALSATSTNPVQNKVVKAALDAKASQVYVQQQIAAIPDELPPVTASDNKKVLTADNGEWKPKLPEFVTGTDEQVTASVENYIEENDMMTLNGDNGDAVIFLHYNDTEETWDETTPASVATIETTEGKQLYPKATISASSAVSSVKLHKSGVNMLPDTTRVYLSYGRLDYYGTDGGLYLPAGTYTLFLNWVSSGYVSFYVYDYVNHGTDTRLAYGTVSGSFSFTLNEAHFCSFRVYRNNDVPSDGKLGLCYGSSAPSAWASYSGADYTLSLPSAVTSGEISFKDGTITVSGTASEISSVPSVYASDGLNTVWMDYDTSISIQTQTSAADFDVLSTQAIAPIVRKTFCGVEQSETANLVTVDAIESDDLVVSANVQTAPITLKVHHCGENFLDPSVKATANEVIQYHSADGGLYLPTGTYTLFLSDRSNTVSGLYVNQWVNGAVDSNALFAAYSATELHFTMTEGKYVRLRAYKSGGINQSMSLGLARGSVTPTAFPSYQGEVVTDSASETGVKKITLTAFEGENNVWQENGTVSIEQIPSYEQKVREYAETDAIQKQLSALRSCNPNFFSSAHRGGRFVVPECTEPAMVFAKRQGFTAAENDVNKTSDGVFVMYHDANLDALGYPNVVVRDTTYANLLTYDFGSYVSSEFTGTKILTFEEWLGVCMKLGLRPIIDFKITPENDSDFAADVAALVAIVKKMGMLRKVTWLAYPAQIRAADSRADVYLMGAPYFNSTVNGYILDEDDPRFGFNVELSSLTTAMIETAHDHGVKISAWTNNAADVSESALVSQIEPFVNKGLEWITVNNYAVDKSLISKLIE